ncbi:DUF1002 domain-containing protein [Alkalicoccobacillus porphyridii]|uniref:DUF1002 domain-containing protein n=1 Tax=Alkalicoccobacillus porphyridii TaxID=2597270 RepID=A0A553ZZ52_9BACI|nr:DUF1002 domain-containing protein [Alkalicoccobacillus porphyridii]TSB46729.1 DUF1002 domain-containing protein [Alkalicoccobacillus porphyridii]
MKKILQKSTIFAMMLLLLVPGVAQADAVPGDVIVTLGADLTPAQREDLLEEMGAPDGVEILEVTNEEEHIYLGNYISSRNIGTRALSSSMITMTEAGQGINVESNHITWVSDKMYANALVTAGVEDADIYVTAPFDVSGTAGLTGLIKAYEVAADIDIPEEQKQVANEEMVKTAELAESVGVEEATELINRIKEEIGDQNIETEDDLRALIERIADELGITLTDEELNGLVSLFMRMKDLDINWDQVQEQISKVRDNLGEFLDREETQSFISSFLDFINQIIDSIKNFFRS